MEGLLKAWIEGHPVGLRPGHRLGEVHLIDEGQYRQMRNKPLSKFRWFLCLKGGASQTHRTRTSSVETCYPDSTSYSSFWGAKWCSRAERIWECSSSQVPCPAKSLEAVPETQAVTCGATCGTLEHTSWFGLLQRKHSGLGVTTFSVIVLLGESALLEAS